MLEASLQQKLSSVGASELIVLRLKNVGELSCVIQVSLLSLQLLGNGPVLEIRKSEQFGYSWSLFWLPWRTSEPNRPRPKNFWDR